MIVTAYVAGLLTIPVLAALSYGGVRAFGHSAVLAHESQCDFCTELGYSQHLPQGAHRRGVSQWLYDLAHRFFIARRMPHRVLWQDWFEDRPRDWVRDPRAWKIYGLGRPNDG